MTPSPESSRPYAKKRPSLVRRFAVLVGVMLLGMASMARAATITIINGDGPGEGFNDPAPRSPVGGNTGTTLGQQRLIAVQYAAHLWGEVLESAVEIVVEASFRAFDSADCVSNSALLGYALPLAAFADFAGAPRAKTLYASALADSLAGIDLNPGVPDIAASLNGQLDAGCFSGGAPNGWYYGLDGRPSAGRINLLPAVLHELAHGLGFATFVSLPTGRRCCSLQPLQQYDDAFMIHLEDHDSGLLWPDMMDLQRAASAIDTGRLHWVGNNALAAGESLTSGRSDGHIRMYAPLDLREGSSVSHFDTLLLPDELMEPFLVSNASRQLTTAVFKDIGWRVAGDPTPTMTASPTVTLSSTPTSTPSLTGTPTDTPTQSPTWTRTPSRTRTPSHTLTSTRTATRSRTPTPTRSDTPTATVTPTETLTPTITPTPSTSPTAPPSPTSTLTATVTATDTATPTPTLTPPATSTHTASPSVTRTPTASITPTASMQPTPSTTPTASSTPPPSPTSSVTPSETPTPTATATASATPFCPGDCDGDRQVLIAELQIGASIFLTEMDPGSCRSADVDGSGAVELFDLQLAADAFLLGCDVALSGVSVFVMEQ
jgi:hypothetical protein